MRIRAVAIGILGLFPLAGQVAGQDVDAGRKVFESRCARCHGADGNGGEMGPPITFRLTARNDQQLAALIHEGLPARGMPPSAVVDPELTDLVKFLRSIQQLPEEKPIERLKIQTTAGATLDGQLLSEGFNDLQLLTDDKRLHLLRRTGDRAREVTSETDWPTYNGDPRGNRYTSLTQIDKTTISRLAPKWVFPVAGAGQLQGTPVVAGGIMYVTAPNECNALDAGTGRRIWQFKRPRTAGITAGSANRGAGVAGDRVFIETDDAHIVALNRYTGDVLWDTALEDWRKNYAASSAPL